LLEATAKILEENGIRYPYSPDLGSVWDKSVVSVSKPGQATTQ
jgi:hypothetical protein